MKKFAGILSNQLIFKVHNLNGFDEETEYLDDPFSTSIAKGVEREYRKRTIEVEIPEVAVTLNENGGSQGSFSSLSYDDTPDVESGKNQVVDQFDNRGCKHTAVKFETKVCSGKESLGRRYTTSRKCRYRLNNETQCTGYTRVKCVECDKPLCYPLKGKFRVTDSCFYKHVICRPVNEKDSNKKRKCN